MKNRLVMTQNNIGKNTTKILVQTPQSQ